MERTLTILKPDSVSAGRVGAILAHLEREGFRFCAMKRVRLSPEQARAFYAVHRDRPFYDALVRFMTEGPIIVVALERTDAVAHLRRQHHLAMGDGNRAVRERHALPALGDEGFAPDLAHHIEDAVLQHLPGVDLLSDHLLAGQFDIHVV